MGEEAIEVVLAGKGQSDQRLVEESADLLYHLLVLLASRGLTLDAVRAELVSRRRWHNLHRSSRLRCFDRL